MSEGLVRIRVSKARLLKCLFSELPLFCIFYSQYCLDLRVRRENITIVLYAISIIIFLFVHD